LDSESAIAVETRFRKRTARRSSTDVAPTADVRTADMTATMTAASRMMTTTAMMATTTSRAMTTAMTTTAVSATATFRSGIPAGRQRGGEDNDDDLDAEF
jgi:hypothetical protein